MKKHQQNLFVYIVISFLLCLILFGAFNIFIPKKYSLTFNLFFESEIMNTGQVGVKNIQRRKKPMFYLLFSKKMEGLLKEDLKNNYPDAKDAWLKEQVTLFKRVRHARSKATNKYAFVENVILMTIISETPELGLLIMESFIKNLEVLNNEFSLSGATDYYHVLDYPDYAEVQPYLPNMTYNLFFTSYIFMCMIFLGLLIFKRRIDVAK